MAGALDDLRVIDASGPIGHYAGRLLADLGADVIKVEPPEGDPARLYPPFLPDVAPPEDGLEFLLLNANKRGVTIDLTRPEGRDVFLRLLATADVLIESWRPQELRALDLTADVLGEARPDLIRASLTGWGLSGPRSEWAYADIVGLAMSGVMILAGFPNGPPEQIGDLQGYHCASLNAAAGVISALIHRDATGNGQLVEVSLQESLTIAQETAMQMADILGTDRVRTGGEGPFPVRMPGSGLYECADGYVVMSPGGGGRGLSALVDLMQETGEAADLTEEPYTSIINEQLNTATLMAAAQDPSLLDAIRPRWEHIEEVISDYMRRHPMTHIYEGCQNRRQMAAMASTPRDLSENPQLNARGWFVDVDDPGRDRRFRYPGVVWQFKGTPATLRRPAPLLGEHNAEIANELRLEPALRNAFVGAEATR